MSDCRMCGQAIYPAFNHLCSIGEPAQTMTPQSDDTTPKREFDERLCRKSARDFLDAAVDGGYVPGMQYIFAHGARWQFNEDSKALADRDRLHAEFCEQAQDETDADFSLVRDAAEKYKAQLADRDREIAELKERLDTVTSANKLVQMNIYSKQDRIDALEAKANRQAVTIQSMHERSVRAVNALKEERERIDWLERIKEYAKRGDYINAEIEILGYEGNCKHQSWDGS